MFSPFVVADDQDGIRILWEIHQMPGVESPAYTNGIYCIEGDGTFWSEPIDVIVAPQGGRSFWPQHAVDAWGRLHVVWVGPNAALYYSATTVSNACNVRSWYTVQLPEAGQILNAAIVADEIGILHVAYAARGESVYYLRSEEGISWSTPVLVSAAAPGVASAMPEIAVAPGGRLHVVWEEVRLPEGVPSVGLYYAQSRDGGQTWSPALEIADGGHTQPNVAALQDGTVHLLWNGRAGVRGRYHQWSRDGGETWSSVEEFVPKVLGGGQTGAPRYAVDSAGALHIATGTGNAVHVVWDGQRWSQPEEIAYGNLIEHTNLVSHRGRFQHLVAYDSSVRLLYALGMVETPETRSPFHALAPVMEEAKSTVNGNADSGEESMLTAATPPAPTAGEPATSRTDPLLLGIGAAGALVIVALLVTARGRR
jgi:hypothetical protein